MLFFPLYISSGIIGHYMAEMQQPWGEAMQTFLSPDLQATWLFIAWDLMTLTEPWGREQSGMSAESRGPCASLACDLPHSLVISGLCFGFSASLKEISKYLVKRKPV